MSTPTLEQLAAARIATLQAEITELDRQIATATAEVAKYQAVYDATPDDDTTPNKRLRSLTNNYIEGYGSQVTSFNVAKTIIQARIDTMIASLGVLSDADKVLAVAILTTYNIDLNSFDFNVKPTFMNQVRSIYENVGYDEKLKRVLIEGLARGYRHEDY